MLIKSIQFENYACFEHINIELNNNFNVIVGINGSGKTSLLNGIRDFLEVYLQLNPENYYELTNPRLCMIKSGLSIRFESQYPIKITAKAISFDNSNLKNNIYQKLNITQRSTYAGESINIRSDGAKYITTTMPLGLFYKADRHWNGTNLSDITIAQQKPSRLNAFQHWDQVSLGSAALHEWVIAKTLERLESFERTGNSVLGQATDELSCVNHAISLVIPEARGLRYDLGQKTLILEWKDGDSPRVRTMPFEKLSEGQKAVIGLVADLARRACLLNPHLETEAVSKTPGVVLIDEMDLHLHPSWQRQLPIGLKKAFPAIQFIATTHSPLILSELVTNEIILLDNFQPSTPRASYGLNSDHILVEILGSPYRPEKIDLELKELFIAINQGKLEKAKAIIEDLSEKAPGIRELAGAKALIMRKETIGR